MSTTLIVILCIIVYLIISYIIYICTDDLEMDERIGYSIFWPLIVAYHLCSVFWL